MPVDTRVGPRRAAGRRTACCKTDAYIDWQPRPLAHLGRKIGTSFPACQNPSPDLGEPRYGDPDAVPGGDQQVWAFRPCQKRPCLQILFQYHGQLLWQSKGDGTLAPAPLVLVVRPPKLQLVGTLWRALQAVALAPLGTAVRLPARGMHNQLAQSTAIVVFRKRKNPSQCMHNQGGLFWQQLWQRLWQQDLATRIDRMAFHGLALTSKGPRSQARLCSAHTSLLGWGCAQIAG
jgi:hypothetical protein